VGASRGMHLPRQPCSQATFRCMKAPGTPRLCRRMMQHSSCCEDKLWERDVCPESKKRQARPPEQTNGAQRRIVLVQHGLQKWMGKKDVIE